MRAYKLCRKMKDGSLSSLFINKKSRIPVGVWLESECHPTNGFAVRQGWHCTLEPRAPHLKQNPKNQTPRVWVEVQVVDYEHYNRPESQGGTWVLAQKMRVIGEVPVQIEDGEWLCSGNFIQKQDHPKLEGKYVVFSNNEEQTHIAVAYSFSQAVSFARLHPCNENYQQF